MSKTIMLGLITHERAVIKSPSKNNLAFNRYFASSSIITVLAISLKGKTKLFTIDILLSFKNMNMLMHLYTHLVSLVQQVRQKRLLIPAVSVTLLPPEVQGVLLMIPVHTYRPSLDRLLSGVEIHQDIELHDGRVRWLLSQEFHRTLSQHWQMYRLTPDQTIDLVSSLLQKRVLESSQISLKPYSQEISECLTDEFADIFPDPWHIQPDALLRAISRYEDFTP